MATNFFKYGTGSADGRASAFGAGASGVNCTAGVGCTAGRVYTGSREDAAGSGLFLGWAVDFWGSSISSVPLPSLVSSGEVSSFYCLHCSSTMVSIRHSSSGFTSS